jgi:hypothetical protein
MTRRSGATTLVGAVGLVELAALVGHAGCSLRHRAEREGPFLSIVNQESPVRGRSPISPESIALALGGLPPEELTRVREYLAQSADATARRAAPALFDLDFGEDAAAHAADDPLRPPLPDVPAWTAASNVLGAPWSAPGLSVQLGATCASAASRCVPLFAPRGDRDDALVRRGRALAWSLGNAALLRVPAASRAALLQSLRGAQTRPSSTIALVFGAPRGTLNEARLERLRDQARLTLADLASDAPLRPWLNALGAARPTWELPIAFDADQVLVVPRLGALARLPEFHSELALAAAPIDYAAATR